MSTECYPDHGVAACVAALSRLPCDGRGTADAPVRRWYGAEPFGREVDGESVCRWGDAGAAGGCAGAAGVEFGAGAAALANIEKLRAGAGRW